jgi:hypothetical protein
MTPHIGSLSYWRSDAQPDDSTVRAGTRVVFLGLAVHSALSKLLPTQLRQSVGANPGLWLGC